MEKAQKLSVQGKTSSSSRGQEGRQMGSRRCRECDCKVTSTKGTNKSKSRVWKTVLWFTRKGKSGKMDFCQCNEVDGDFQHDLADSTREPPSVHSNSWSFTRTTSRKFRISSRKRRSKSDSSKKSCPGYAKCVASGSKPKSVECGGVSCGSVSPTATGSFCDFGSNGHVSSGSARKTKQASFLTEIARELNPPVDKPLREATIRIPSCELSKSLSSNSVSYTTRRLSLLSDQGVRRCKSFSGPFSGAFKRRSMDQQGEDAGYFSPPLKQKCHGHRRTATFGGNSSDEFTNAQINMSKSANMVDFMKLEKGSSSLGEIQDQDGSIIGIVHFYKSPKSSCMRRLSSFNNGIKTREVSGEVCGTGNGRMDVNCFNESDATVSFPTCFSSLQDLDNSGFSESYLETNLNSSPTPESSLPSTPKSSLLSTPRSPLSPTPRSPLSPTPSRSPLLPTLLSRTVEDLEDEQLFSVLQSSQNTDVDGSFSESCLETDLNLSPISKSLIAPALLSRAVEELENEQPYSILQNSQNRDVDGVIDSGFSENDMEMDLSSLHESKCFFSLTSPSQHLERNTPSLNSQNACFDGVDNSDFSEGFMESDLKLSPISKSLPALSSRAVEELESDLMFEPSTTGKPKLTTQSVSVLQDDASMIAELIETESEETLELGDNLSDYAVSGHSGDTVTTTQDIPILRAEQFTMCEFEATTGNTDLDNNVSTFPGIDVSGVERLQNVNENHAYFQFCENSSGQGRLAAEVTLADSLDTAVITDIQRQQDLEELASRSPKECFVDGGITHKVDEQLFTTDEADIRDFPTVEEQDNSCSCKCLPSKNYNIDSMHFSESLGKLETVWEQATACGDKILKKSAAMPAGDVKRGDGEKVSKSTVCVLESSSSSDYASCSDEELSNSSDNPLSMWKAAEQVLFNQEELRLPVPGKTFKMRTELILRWFKEFNDEQRNIVMKKLLNRCELPQMHLLSVAMEPNLHKACPPNCQDMLVWLPYPVALKILTYLDTVSLCQCNQVNKAWNELTNNPQLWQQLTRKPDYQVSEASSRKQYLKYTLPNGNIHWKKVLAERFLLHLNWLNGKYTLRTYEGHNQGIACVQFDNTRIVSGSSDKTIKLWDIRNTNSELMLTLEGHSGTVRCLDLNGNRLVSGSTDRTIKVWDLSFASYWAGASCKVTMVGHLHTVRCLQADEKKLVSGSYDKTVKVWDLKTGDCQLTLRGHTAAVLCVQFDDQKIVSGSYDKKIKVWDLTEGICLMTLDGHQDAVTCLNLTHDGMKIITGSLDYSLKFWDLLTGKCYGTLDWITSEGHTAVVRCLQVDSWRIISGGDDKTLKVWELATGQRLLTLRYHSDGVTCMQFSDFTIVSGSYDRTVKLWDFTPKHPYLEMV